MTRSVDNPKTPAWVMKCPEKTQPETAFTLFLGGSTVGLLISIALDASGAIGPYGLRASAPYFWYLYFMFSPVVIYAFIMQVRPIASMIYPPVKFDSDIKAKAYTKMQHMPEEDRAFANDAYQAVMGLTNDAGYTTIRRVDDIWSETLRAIDKRREIACESNISHHISAAKTQLEILNDSNRAMRDTK